MRRRIIASIFVVMAVTATVLLAEGPRQHAPKPPRHQPAIVIRGEVFVGGYFYDPIFGPYPWWPRTLYPYRYFPHYDERAHVRMRVLPDHAAVYVDGFYAGVVDDFDGVFDGLPLSPGGHSIVFFLEGYRTVRHNLYVPPGTSFSIREQLEPLPLGTASERPTLVPPVPPPPPGSYRLPLTSPSSTLSVVPGQALPIGAMGTLDLRVQPASARVLIDNERWASSDGAHFVVQLPVGSHRVEVTELGYQRFITDILIRDGETSTLNVSLIPAVR
jgi:hypothetical protein